MTSCPNRAPSQSLVSIVVCSSLLTNDCQALQKELGANVLIRSDFESGLATSKQVAPSILIVDYDALKAISPGALRVRLALAGRTRVVVCMHDASDNDLIELLRCGIAGFVQIGESLQIIRKAIQRIIYGELWAPRRIVSEALRSMVSVIDDARFTRRELEILHRIAAGQDNREIAEELAITRETVRWHLRSAYGKLGVHDRNLAATLINKPA